MKQFSFLGGAVEYSGDIILHYVKQTQHLPKIMWKWSSQRLDNYAFINVYQRNATFCSEIHVLFSIRKLRKSISVIFLDYLLTALVFKCYIKQNKHCVSLQFLMHSQQLNVSTFP